MTSRALLPSAGYLLFASLALTACGGKSIQGDGAPRAPDSGGAAGSAAGVGGGGSGGATSTGVCADAGVPLSSAGVPDAVGCYGYGTSGWVRIACNCELLIQNPMPALVEVSVNLTLSGGDATTSDVEVAFDDPDGSWAKTWAAQAAKVGTFSVIGQGTTTVVRLGVESISLDAVSLAGCEMRAAEASLGGLPWSSVLSMQAALTDAAGSALADLGGACVKPPHL